MPYRFNILVEGYLPIADSLTTGSLFARSAVWSLSENERTLIEPLSVGSVHWGLAKANMPGAFGVPFGRGGRCCATAFIGASIQGFSARPRQHANAMRTPAARRMFVKAPTMSPKNHAKGRGEQVKPLELRK